MSKIIKYHHKYLKDAHVGNHSVQDAAKRHSSPVLRNLSSNSIPPISPATRLFPLVLRPESLLFLLLSFFHFGKDIIYLISILDPVTRLRVSTRNQLAIFVDVDVVKETISALLFGARVRGGSYCCGSYSGSGSYHGEHGRGCWGGRRGGRVGCWKDQRLRCGSEKEEHF